MLLQNPLHVERRCPRSRALLAGGVLLTLAVLLAGIGLRLEAAPPSEQTSQSKTVRIFVEVEGSKPRVVTVPGTKVRKFKGIRVGANDAQPDLEPFRKLMKKLQDNPSLDPTDFAKELKKAVEKMNRELNKGPIEVEVEVFPFDRKKIDVEKLRKKLEGVTRMQVPPPPFGYVRPRLGLKVDRPSQILADQLSLPKGKGLVISDVMQNSPASAAGLKRNDILLKINDKYVSSNIEELYRSVSSFKPGAELSVVVVRKGKQIGIKGVKLPGGRKTRNKSRAGGAKGSKVFLTIRVMDKRFEARYRASKLNITVNGKTEANKAKVESIKIDDAGQSSSYDAVNKVPGKYRDKIDYIIQMLRRPQVKKD